MTELFTSFFDELFRHKVISIVALCTVTDTVFGFMRAVKQRKFNSCFGINGAIRKITMLLSLVFLVLFDGAIHIDLVSFIPKELLHLTSITKIGTTEFFGFLYISYEIVSILKNMSLCGLPTKKIEKWVRDFLGRYTSELPRT